MTARKPWESGAWLDSDHPDFVFGPDHPDFVTPRRARLIRLDIETERAAAALGEGLPEGAKEGVGELALVAAEPPAATPGRGERSARYPHPERGPARADRASSPPAPATKPCSHWSSAGCCGVTPARLYTFGWRCADHAPMPAPVPDPAATAAGLRRARELELRALHAAASRNAARVLYALAHVA